MSIDITVIHSWDDEMTCACRGGGNKCIHCPRAGVSRLCLGCWLLIAFEDQPWSMLKTTVFSPLRVAEKVWEDMLNDTIEQKSHRETMNWALKEQLLPESWREGTPGPGLEDAVSMLPFFELLQVTVVSSWWVACEELPSGCTFLFFLQGPLQFPPQTILPLHLLLYHGQWGLFPSNFPH